MFCPTCANPIPDSSAFCLHCGRPTRAPQQTPKNRTGRRFFAAIIVLLIAGVVCVAVLAVIGVAVIGNRQRGSEPEQSQITSLLPRPTPLQLVSDEFALPAGYSKTFSFNLNQAAHITGHFQATHGDNVQVHIFNEDGLQNFQHHSEYRSFYESGKVTAGAIDLKLAQGHYYLVFENTYSFISSKVVRADVTIEPL